VWGKYNYKWVLGFYSDVYTASWDKFSQYPASAIGFNITSNGLYDPVSNGGTAYMSVLTGKDTPEWNWYSKYLVSGSGKYIAEQLTSGTFWCRAGSSYIAQGSASGDVVNPDPNDPSSTSYYRAKFRLYGPAVASPTTKIGNASASSSSHYPSDGLSDDYYYLYRGSDNIDPTAISYPTTGLTPGQSITVTVTPRSNTYGGTISYLYQYSTNGGSTWTNSGAATTSTSKSITIPSNAAQFMARIRAQDDMGFTSTTYVTGDNITFPKYTVSIAVSPTGGGTFSGAGSYYHNTSVTVKATPADGWEFVEWQENGAAVSTSATYTFTINTNRSLTAVFKQKLMLWVGVNGKARKGMEMYVGVNGKARKVTAAYIGVNGKARRFL